MHLGAPDLWPIESLVHRSLRQWIVGAPIFGAVNRWCTDLSGRGSLVHWSTGTQYRWCTDLWGWELLVHWSLAVGIVVALIFGGGDHWCTDLWGWQSLVHWSLRLWIVGASIFGGGDLWCTDLRILDWCIMDQFRLSYYFVRLRVRQSIRSAKFPTYDGYWWLQGY